MKPDSDLVIYIGADHNGHRLKNWLIDHLKNYQVVDVGKKDLQANDDFPTYAVEVVHKMLAKGPKARGILICGSGQGMAIAANRFKGIRAAVVNDTQQAKLVRNDDDSNVLALAAYQLQDQPQKALEIVETWLQTPFEAITRRTRRLKLLDQIH